MEITDGATDPVLILAPGGRDAAVACAILAEAGFATRSYEMLDELVAGLDHAGAVIVAEEALLSSDRRGLADWLAHQPPWSDLPIILLTRRSGSGADPRLPNMLGNVTLLERPFHRETLVSVARAALRARSRQRQAEAHLKERARIGEELERRVAERTRELQEAYTRLRAEVTAREAAQAALLQAHKMEALGQLAGGIAHDVNNVLQAVMGGARLILRRPHDAEAIGRLAHMVVEAAERGAAITRRLLTFARQGELRAEAVDTAALLTDLCEVLAHTLGPAVELAVDLPADGMPALRADRAQLETVLVNLATNARDAMPQGGRLTFAATAEQVDAGRAHPAGLAPGLYLRLSVIDTGQGIPPELLGRVADPFFTTKPRGRGTGLGLAMAKGFAEQSGGGFAIESELGVGTTVTLWLPHAKLAAGPPRLAAGAAERRGMAAALDTPDAPDVQRILLVDDEKLVRDTLAAELTERGYCVREAESSTAALGRLDVGEMFDLLITDLAMPGMDGLELIRRARLRQPGLPALLLTGYAGDGAALALGDAAKGGPFALLRKPIFPPELADRAAVLLGLEEQDGAAEDVMDGAAGADRIAGPEYHPRRPASEAMFPARAQARNGRE